MNEEEVLQPKSRNKNPLGYEPVGSLLKKFAIPSVVMLLVNNLYNIVDQIFIGHGVGYLGNAATTVAFPVITIVLALSLLIGAGGSAYAAIKLGEDQFDVAENVLGNMASLLVIVGVILCLGCFIFFEPMLELFGATERIMQYAKDYTGILLIGVPFMMIGAGFSNMARTDGNPKISMMSMLVGAVLNTILDPIYIFIFHWGVKGAALATITSQILGAVILLWYFTKRGNMRLKREYLKLNWGLVFRFVLLGSSSFIIQVANTALIITMNNSLVYYGNLSEVGGDIALSAMGIVLKVSGILIGINIGISTGNQPIVGFNYGARKPIRIKKAYLMAVGIATVFSVVGWAGCVFFPHYIMKIFGSQDEEFFLFAIRCMQIFMFGIFVSGGQIVSTGYFQATGQAGKASILSLLRQVLLLIPLVIVLPLFMGLDGILYAGPIADIGAACIIFIFVVSEMKKLNGWIEKIPE